MTITLQAQEIHTAKGLEIVLDNMKKDYIDLERRFKSKTSYWDTSAWLESYGTDLIEQAALAAQAEDLLTIKAKMILAGKTEKEWFDWVVGETGDKVLMGSTRRTGNPSKDLSLLATHHFWRGLARAFKNAKQLMIVTN